ncbi:MAG: cation:proton antiporter [Pseudomonadota bacterium]
MNEAVAILPAITLLGVGLACIVAARLVKTSPIVMFIAAGVVIGPSAFGLAELNTTTNLLAQLGVVFLLFQIGLGFSLKTVRESGRDLLGLAPAQMLLCGVGFTLLARLFGLDWTMSILIGLAAGISATAVVTATLAERGITTCPLGRSATSVLVFQDIAGIFLLVFATSLGAAGEEPLGLQLAMAFGKAALAAGAAILVGRLIADPAFRILARTRNQEVFTAAALFIVLATAAATGALGLSLTLGAFLAGMIVAETRYKPRIQGEAQPFGALLLGFFFITVGMGLDWRVLLGDALWILAAVAALFVVKTALTYIAALLNGWSLSGAAQLAFVLAQGSEFGLVILALPAVASALGAEVAAILVAASALSLALTPAWAGFGLFIARRIAALRTRQAGPKEASPDEARPILLFPMNDTGRLALDALNAFDIPVVAIDSDPDRFLAAVADGYQVTFGDPSDMRLMNAVGVTNARALALGATRYEISREVTPYVREHYPDLDRFVAVESEADRARHAALGMTAVISSGAPEGLAFAAKLLRASGIEEDQVSDWMRKTIEAYEPDRMTDQDAA